MVKYVLVSILIILSMAIWFWTTLCCAPPFAR